MKAYSVVITSCGRFDLLRATLASLLPTLDPAPAKILLVEDSGDPAVADVVAGSAAISNFWSMNASLARSLQSTGPMAP